LTNLTNFECDQKIINYNLVKIKIQRLIIFFIRNILKNKNITLFEQFQNIYNRKIVETFSKSIPLNAHTYTTVHFSGLVQALQQKVAGLDYIDLKQVASLI